MVGDAPGRRMTRGSCTTWKSLGVWKPRRRIVESDSHLDENKVIKQEYHVLPMKT